MKIKPDSFTALKNHIAAYVAENQGLVAYRKMQYGDSKAFRWCIMRDSGAFTYEVGLLTRLYDEGLEDSHIDTALRKIIKDLNL